MKTAAVAVLLLAFIAGCGGSRPQSPAPDNPAPPPTPGGVTVTGSERLAWEQELSGSAIGTFTFVAYVDGARAVLGNVSCTGGNPASCSASLPPMSPGPHVLRLAAVRHAGGGYAEGDRSAPFTVNMVRAGGAPLPATAGAPSSTPPLSAADPAWRPPSVDIFSRDVRGVTDLAAAPGGDLFVAERGGVIHILRGGMRLPQPALILADVVRDSDDLALHSLALSPEFERDHRIYFLYSAATRDGVAYRLAAGREIAGRIGEVATLMNVAPASPGAAAFVRIARDGTLHLAASDRIYRVARDGGMPAGATGFSREIAALPAVRSLDWGGEENNLYALTSTSASRLLMKVRDGGAARGHHAVHQWHPPERPVSLAWYGRTEIAAFSGRMLIGTAGGTLQIIDVDARARTRVEMSLGDVGAVVALTVDARGSVFVAASAARVQRPAAPADTELGEVILRLQAREGGK